MPGYLIPDDLVRLQAVLGLEADTFDAWAEMCLRASIGALVAKDGVPFRIPTIVPDVKPDGSCLFLSADGRCGIHADAPFGCRFTDAHMGRKVADRRSAYGLAQIVVDKINVGPYSRLWHNLQAIDKMSPSPEVLRERMRVAWETQQQGEQHGA